MSKTVTLLLDHVEMTNDELAITAGAKVTLNDDKYGEISAMAFGRSVSDGVTKRGSAVVSSATAAFTVGDLGKLITLEGFPRGSRIVQVKSGTEVVVGRFSRNSQNEATLEPYTAPADASGLTVIVGVVQDAA